MTNPLDLTTATRGAVFTALAAGVSPSICTVLDTVPENTQPQYLRGGVIESDPDGKGPQFEKLTVEVIGIYRGGDRDVLSAMLHAGRVALANATLAADGITFSQPRWLGSTIGLALDADGVTYAGLSHYEIWAEPA